MATTGVGFRWLDILEKEFDKACVELDTSLMDLETEEPEVVFSARQKIATLSSCFAQLTHKALSIFQNSAKLEAELVDMRAELVHARAASAGACQDGGDGAGNVPEAARARSEAAQLARENAALRETVLALHSELFGARLATKYLDKELAGRIQQLQLLGRDMRAEVRDSLWAQVEAEILLQRHKTLVRVCRGVSRGAGAGTGTGAGGAWGAGAGPDAPAAPRAPHRPRPRTVRVRRSPHLGLGISVTGGREHGVPILISELEAGGPAALTGELYVGDAILAINDVDLTQACHKEAVAALQSVKGDCALCVQFIATDDDDRLSEDNYRFPLYPEDSEVFGAEPDGSGATPTAPRTPDYNRRVSVTSAASGGARYPDYNHINNNLAILDMDDDNIKIEARLELCAAAGASSGASSTPVHKRAAKKKRKPQDWRTKGAYRAVDPDTASSDEPHTEPSHNDTRDLPRDNFTRDITRDLTRNMTQDIQRDVMREIPRDVTRDMLRDTTRDISCDTRRDISRDTRRDMPNDITRDMLNDITRDISRDISSDITRDMPRDIARTIRDSTRDTREPIRDRTREDTVMQDEGECPALATPPTAPEPRATNGDVKPLRREPKGFRIGSARRVTEAAAGAGAVAEAGAGAGAGAVTNGLTERGKFPARLLAGDGDPDFGTPV